jgi:FkbM family methyltransferase
MNFSGVSNKGFVGRMIRWPLRFIPAEAQLPILQGVLKGKRWIAGSSTHGCWAGSYEYEKQLLFTQTITKGSVVFDIGAHVGFYTLLASMLVQSQGRVFAFEPLPRNAIYLSEHVRINNISNVQIVKAAVTNTCGQLYFDDIAGNSMGKIADSGRIQVKAVSIDELVADGTIPLPNFIKIDVEGAEYLVLTGAQQTLIKAQPTLFLATHGNEVHRQCCDLLIAMGYHLSPISGKSIYNTDEILAQVR